MRHIILFLSALLLPLSASAKLVRDTVITRQNDKIILTYNISVTGEEVAFRVDNRPRIIPGDILRKACKGNLELLKVVIFDRIGDFGNVKWNGIPPTAFTVPSGLSYDKSNEGFYILGETTVPISFTKKKGADTQNIAFPLYIAVYEKKQTYRLVGSGYAPLRVPIRNMSATASPHGVKTDIETERIAIRTTEEVGGDNDEIAKALSSMRMIRQLLDSEAEIPFSQTLQMEIFNLRSLKGTVKDPKVIDMINEVLLMCNDKERELKESHREALLNAQAQEQALIAQQKAEEDARRKEAEEKARVQEEKQQKRTLWMILGSAILAILAFIGNGIFKHYRDLQNQKNIMEMQESLAKQAQHEASRRSREIVRNKAHQLANSGKSKMRETINGAGKTNKNTKIKSI